MWAILMLHVYCALLVSFSPAPPAVPDHLPARLPQNVVGLPMPRLAVRWWVNGGLAAMVDTVLTAPSAQVASSDTAQESDLVWEDVNGMFGEQVALKLSKVPVSFSMHDRTVQAVLQEIARQAHLWLVYDIDSRALAQRISRDFVKMGVPDALDSAIAGTHVGLFVRADGKTVFVHARGGSISHRPHLARGLIIGRVTDSTTGAEIRGARVQVVGLPQYSAVTTDRGTFTIQHVPPGDLVIDVQLAGYRPAEWTITIAKYGKEIPMVLVPNGQHGAPAQQPHNLQP